MPNRIVRSALDHLVEDLRSTHGENLVSVVLYGSAAAGDYVELRSDYNVLVALNRITPEDLRQAQAPTREWQRLGHPVPVYFTVDELNEAGDVFPIEFHQMRRARRILYGRDPFAELEFSDAQLRHQTEYELRSKLIQLRRLYIPASVSLEKLSSLMSDSLASFAALFSPVLILMGKEPPLSKPECVRSIAKLLKLDGETFERIFSLRANAELSLTESEAHELFASYLVQIERVIEVVDSLTK